MGKDFFFEDYTLRAKNVINAKIEATLEEVSGELVSQVKRNSRRDTGKTAETFSYKVMNKSASGYESHIGSDYMNAIWEEFGTGEHALKGNGRKGGWSYKDEKGKWHHTQGKRPSRAFFHAYTGMKSVIKQRIQNALKGL